MNETISHGFHKAYVVPCSQSYSHIPDKSLIGYNSVFFLLVFLVICGVSK